LTSTATIGIIAAITDSQGGSGKPAVKERRRSIAPEGAQALSSSHLGSTVMAMAPLPRVTGRDVVQALRRLGWVVVVQKGSHVQLRNPVRGGRVTVPVHAGETIGPGLLRSILAQAGLSRDEFRTPVRG
jgi:predicted RNA binding protein YcfA (HicA-like mRNA interferase family)